MLRPLLTYPSSDVVNPKDVMTSKRDSIARFIHVVKSLADVYELPPTSLHVFYDISGATIAFNRNASLFLNLRFFEACRKLSILLSSCVLPLMRTVDDEDVRKGELSKAYISWYGELLLFVIICSEKLIRVIPGILRWPTRSHITLCNHTTQSMNSGSHLCVNLEWLHSHCC